MKKERGRGLDFAVGFPVEAEIKKDETNFKVLVSATSNEAADVLAEEISEATGSMLKEKRVITQEELENTSGFFYSSKSWGVSWEPKGPKHNWKPPPKNPKLN